MKREISHEIKPRVAILKNKNCGKHLLLIYY